MPQGSIANLAPDAQTTEVPFPAGAEIPSTNNEKRRERKGAIVAPELCYKSCCLPCVGFYSCWNNYF